MRSSSHPIFSMLTRYVRKERVGILPILIEFQSDIRLMLDPNCHLDISEYELISIYLLSSLSYLVDIEIVESSSSSGITSM